MVGQGLKVGDEFGYGRGMAVICGWSHEEETILVWQRVEMRYRLVRFCELIWK